MGTRNLTAVVSEGKFVLAQYGQWDGHPSGQGRTALDFCRKRLKKSTALFKEKLARVRFSKDGEIEQLAQSVGVKDGWMDMHQAKKLHQLAPYISRDHGAQILELVWNATGEVLVNDQSDFAADSLFCEFAYVIDLDKNTFEAYKGFQKDPPPQGERFASMPKAKAGNGDESEYYPVHLVASWSLSELPTAKGLCKAFDEDAEDAEDTEAAGE